tara:strand:+ start:10872 stop:11462 length:591 start_codon:yes stop_codon:yes gene_type:complete
MYLLATVPPEVSSKLDEIVKQKHTIKANHDLAGNIKNEFMIPDAKPIIWPLLDILIKEWAKKYPSEFARLGSMSNQEEFRLMLFNTWVNFQKKHEFNPIHTHDGVFSFVIWHKVPFTQKDEYARFPNMKEDQIKAGHFAFVVTNQMGKVIQHDMCVDNTWEGKMALFPADLNHIVYPFYTSDEYRISISGNVGFQL